MTHSFLHFAIGFIVGTSAMLINFIAATPTPQTATQNRQLPQTGTYADDIRYILFSPNCRPSTRAIGWIMLSVALGAWGLVPKLIFRLTDFHSNALWTNIFCGYGIINRLRPGGGMVIGGLIILLAATVQYFIIVWQIKRQAD